MCSGTALRSQQRNQNTSLLYPVDKRNAYHIIQEYDIVVDGCDNFATRYLINDICIEQKKPYVYGAICGFEGQVSVFNYGNQKRTTGIFILMKKKCNECLLRPKV